MTEEARDNLDLIVGNYFFQQVEDFKYIGVNINQNSNMHNKIKLKIFAANKGYYALGKLFRSKLLSKQSKEFLYSSFLHPVLTYAYETWSNTKGDEEKMACFERRVLRRIYGPILEN
ncbi:Hypothetical protein CINCED_3A009305 [Cinara cedri]|uniref:Reverse transcriptase domain n=1 Tax=Cinara cedri TaxID=506608 RepID=A0A5E4MG00_9HEMI|nr:Hypothetical protein CINCED_3A009305 [Cinara cedri]